MSSCKLLMTTILALSLLAASSVTLGEPTEITGELGPGALYSLTVPEDWNGDVIYFAHGYIPRDDPLTLANGDPLKSALVPLGYAVAQSSYSQNGWAVAEGIRQTHQLRGLFHANFGRPNRSYLIGQSMGGAIVLAMAEKFPRQYDGVLPMCGVVGGTYEQVNHVMTIRVLFDYFYPGVLPGNATYLPEGTDFWVDIYPVVVSAVGGNPGPGFELAGVVQADLDVSEFADLLYAMLFNLWGHTNFLKDFPIRTHGHPFFDNSEVLYTGSSDDDALNAGVDRFSPVARPAEILMDRVFMPTGMLEIPVLTLHNASDPLVPISAVERLEALVEAAGSSDMLAQQTVSTFGHCEFTIPESLAAFFDLVNWVETGIKP